MENHQEKIKLGNTGLAIPKIGLGCMSISGAYGAADQGEALRTLNTALDLGVSLLNTADFYGGGENERLIGSVLATRRKEAVIATKIGMRRDSTGRPTIIDGTPAYLAEACDASLKRLGVEAIDLLILNRIDPGVPVEESVGALSALVKAGKVRAIGLSEAPPQMISRAQAVHPLAVLESEYSLWERHVEAEVLPVLAYYDIVLLATCPLGRGFLTGGVSSPDELEERDFRRRHPRFHAENMGRNRVFVEVLAEVARRKGATPAQVALAWALSRGSTIAPIPGTKHAERVAENRAACGLVLSLEDRAMLEALPAGAAGDRYPSEMLRAVPSAQDRAGERG